MQRLLCLKASAGSGKTFALAARYLALLFLGASPSEVLAVTFTNKAANEMRSRIVGYLKNLENESDFLQALVDESGLSEDELLQKRNLVLDTFLRHDLYIMTIDSFLQRIARKFAYYGGVDVDFEVGKDDLDDIWRLFVRKLSEQEFSRLVRLAQEHKGTQDFFEKLYEKEKEFSHLALSMEHRFFALMEEIGKKREAILQQVQECPDVKKFFSQSIGAIKKDGKLQTIRKRGTIDYPQSIFGACDNIASIEPLVMELLALLDRYPVEREKFLKSAIFDFFRRYRQTKWSVKLQENYLDFKDIEHLVFELLREHNGIDNEFLYFRLDTKIRHILIDEFQDTSITQWKIFEPLVQEISASEEGFRSFFYVGDTKQAIYRFRGGSSELFELVQREIPYLVERRLDTNYRSGEVIVQFVNELFDLDEKAVKEGGYVEVLMNEEPKNRRSSKFGWRNNLKGALSKLLQKGVALEDIAILVYKNETILEVADFLESELELKAVTSTRQLVIHQPKARAVIELLKGLYYGERGALFRANFLSFVGLGLDTEIDIAIDRPDKMIKSVLDRYDLWDASTLKLLEHSMMYDELVDFVHAIEQYQEELPNGGIEGVRVMTIHKAKGLEFDHVIVLDAPFKEKIKEILYDYEGIELRDLRINVGGLEKVDGTYAKVLQKERESIRRDARNMEYVAYTRAKRSLFVLRNPRQSSFVQLHERGIETLQRGKITIKKEEDGDVSLKEKFRKRLRYVGRQERKKQKEYKPNDYEAIYLGLAMHALFEMDGNDYALNNYGLFCDFERARELYEKGKSFEEYRKLLVGKIYKEFPFVYNNQAGAIDLLIEKEDEIVIIDYKSARPHDQTPYYEQVRFYMKAMRAIKKKPVRGYLFYVGDGNCELKEVR